jgi:hypothetical protein
VGRGLALLRNVRDGVKPVALLELLFAEFLVTREVPRGPHLELWNLLLC